MRWIAATVALGAATVLLALRLPLCPTALLLGLPCPSCGLTRAVFALLHGDFRAAVALHPLVMFVLPAVVLGVGRVTWARSSPGVKFDRLLRWGAALLLAALVAVWVARFLGHFGGPVPIPRSLWDETSPGARPALTR